MRLAVLADASLLHTYRWVEYFVKQGDEILLISLEEGVVPAKVDFIKIKQITTINFLKYALALPTIKHHLTRFQPQAIIGHFVPNYGLLATLSGVRPNIICAWGSDILVSAFKSPLHQFKAKWILNRADLITADAQEVVNKIDFILNKPTPILLEPLGIEPELYPHNGNQKQDIILSVRNFEPVYDLSTLLKALSHLKDSAPNIQAIIIGKGSEQQKLHELTHAFGLDSIVQFLSPLQRHELITRYNQAKIYVSTAISDGSSVSLLEAMICGCLPIVTDIPSNREWIRPEHNGYLFECGNHKQLAELILYAIQSPLHNNFQAYNCSLILEKANYYQNMATIRLAILKLVEHDKG